MWNRSYCPKCLKQIAWYDNIPIFSFLWLRGRGRCCGQRISWQYPAVELATGVLFVIAFLANFEFQILNFDLILIIQLLRDWFIISVMIVIFIYDLRWYLILDKVTIPAMIIVFILNLFLGFSLWNLLVSGIIGGSFFLLQFVVSKGKWIGGGDIRLGLLMGLSLGWPQVMLAIFLGYIIGSIVSIFLILLKKKKWGSQIPLGIFLSTGTIIALLWGERILDWYLNIYLF